MAVKKFKKRTAEKRSYKKEGVLKVNFDLVKVKIKEFLSRIQQIKQYGTR